VHFGAAKPDGGLRLVERDRPDVSPRLNRGNLWRNTNRGACYTSKSLRREWKVDKFCPLLAHRWRVHRSHTHGHYCKLTQSFTGTRNLNRTPGNVNLLCRPEHCTKPSAASSECPRLGTRGEWQDYLDNQKVNHLK